MPSELLMRRPSRQSGGERRDIAAAPPIWEKAVVIGRLSTSHRRKLMSILLAVAIFASLAVLTTLALGRPVINGVLNAVIVGSGVGLFEEFYVQSRHGRWLRSIHPLKSILIYTLVVVGIFVISIHLIRVVLWNFGDLPAVYRRIPSILPIVITYSVIGIVVMRVVHFIGLETLFHLTIGTYHRPVVEEKEGLEANEMDDSHHHD